MNLAQYKKQYKEIPVKMGEESFNIAYYPNLYTPRHEQSMGDQRSSATAGATFNALLLPVLHAWDLTDDFPKATVAPGYEPKTEPDMLVFNVESNVLVSVCLVDTEAIIVDGVEVAPLVRLTGESANVIIPITKLGITDVPFPIMSEVMTTINADMTPGKEPSSSSSGSF